VDRDEVGRLGGQRLQAVQDRLLAADPPGPGRQGEPSHGVSIVASSPAAITTRKLLIPGPPVGLEVWPQDRLSARSAYCLGSGPPNRLPRPAATIRAVQVDMKP
jgi:hypothetical protein